jgi:CxxC-x17-CxxC domain-containing protein
MGEGEMEFVDRLLKCCDCGNEFVFTAGEQIFFYDKQFKNDPKRCKLCKAKRAGLGRTASANGNGAALPLSRTETRTECSACGIETTVPFKPTQGRPVLCRSCFQLKRVPSGVAAAVAMDSPAERIAEQSAALESAIAAGALDSAAPVAATSDATTTVEQIAEAPSAVVNEATASSATAELLAAAAEPPQA